MEQTEQTDPASTRSSTLNATSTPSLLETDPEGREVKKRFTMTTTTGTSKRFYKKPAEPRAFAMSARRRQSVLNLGSITHLQHFYAKRGIIIKPKKPKNMNDPLTIATNTTDLLQITAEPEEFPPTPLPPSPPPLPSYITSKLDIETDPEVLLATCHINIQEMLDAWCFTIGEAEVDKNSVSLDILDVISTTTKAVQSVKNYSMYKEDLSIEGLSKIRGVTLEVLEMISNLEREYRDDDTDDSCSEDGHIYKESSFRSLEKERAILKKYLEIVEDRLLFDDKEVYPNISYVKNINDNQTTTKDGNNNNNNNSVTSSEGKRDSGVASLITPPASPGFPNLDWVNPENFADDADALGRYHCFLEAHRPSKSKQASDYVQLPDPRHEKAEFFAALADGKLLCIIFNTVVRRSKRPFGFVDKIHDDTARLYRAAENLKFFFAACKLRFDIKFEVSDALEIVRLTDKGKEQLEKVLETFCEAAMDELITTGAYKMSPLSRVASIYLSDSASSSQLQLHSDQGSTISEAEFTKAFANNLSVKN